MEIVDSVVKWLNEGYYYLRANAWQIAILLCVLYLMKHKILAVWKSYAGSHKLSCSRNRSVGREEEMLQIRMRQQEIANERAKEAAKLREQKKEEERKRKNLVAKSKPKGGEQLGKSSAATDSGYNPMQPWTSSGGGGGYRPRQRTVRRGG